MPRFSLPRCLDIAAATTLAAELARALAVGDLTVDATAVAKVDAAGMQLLCALALTARAQAARVEWQNVPAVLANAAHVLALTDALGWPPARAQESA